MTINPTALADVGDRIRNRMPSTAAERTEVTINVRPADMTPYEARLTRWIVEDSDGIEVLTRWHGVSRFTVESMTDAPSNRSFSLPVFFSWLRQQQLEPFPTPSITTPQETTVTFATPAQMRDYRSLTPEQMEPWRKTFIRFVTEAKAADEPNGMSEDWLTNDEDPGRVDSSTLRRAMERPDRMPGTIGRHFPDWLEANHITEPDPTTPTVPSGDNVIPIGPDHPGWDDFWQRARRAAGPSYGHYWQTLADSMGYVQPVQPVREQRVTVDLTYRVEVTVPMEGGPNYIQVAAQDELRRQIRSGRDINRHTDSVVRREPVTA